MPLEWFIIFLSLAAWWFWRLRSNYAYACRPYNVLRGPLQDIHVDFVVVGAGPGGLAACQHLIRERKDTSVLLIERGVDPSPVGGPLAALANLTYTHNLLSYAVELVGSKLDYRWKLHHPLRRCTSDEDNNDTSSLTPYPRGCAVGGTSVMDWALYFKPIPVKAVLNSEEEKEVEVDVPHSFVVSRNPLSWGFAESSFAVLKSKHLATSSAPCARNSVFPGLLRIDKNGCRLPLSHYLLRKEFSRFSLVEGCEVVDFSLNEEGAVESIRCRLNNSREFQVRVRKGVILSAGIIGTSQIIRQSIPRLQARYMVRDSIALPLIFQACPGLSDDRHRLRSFKSHMAWWVAQRGPFLNSVCDTLAAVDVPSLGPRAELVIFLLPFGGRDPALYRRLGLNRTLGMFREGLTMFMTLRGVDDGMTFELFTDSSSEKNGMSKTSSLHHQSQKVLSSSVSNMSPALVTKLVDAFMDGIQLCRKIVAEPPLVYFSTGKEAVDATLLGDNKRAVQYVQLMRTPSSKLTGRQRSGAPAVLLWVKETSESRAYMEAYVRQHAMWLGFGSGSCAASLANDESLRVKGTQNIFIGDCSAVAEKMWSDGGGDVLRAGSVSTAMSIGRAAAIELLSL